MAHEPVTVEQFKIAKPQFDSVSDDTIQMYLDMAGRAVDKSWTAGDYQNAIIAFACHLMTLEGLGTDAASKSHKTGAAEYQSVKSGQLTLTRFRQEAGESTDYFSWLNSTPCGRYYVYLFMANRGGPRVAMGGIGCCPSGFAKDWCGPAYGWPGVFF